MQTKFFFNLFLFDLVQVLVLQGCWVSTCILFHGTEFSRSTLVLSRPYRDVLDSGIKKKPLFKITPISGWSRQAPMYSKRPDINGSPASTFTMYTNQYKLKNIQIALQYEYTIYTIEKNINYISLVINDKNSN